MPSTTLITTPQLARLIGVSQAPAIVDIRIDDDIEPIRVCLPGPCVKDHRSVSQWAAEYRGRSVVVVCQKGQKLSEGAAAWLQHEGISAETLEGGFEGWKKAGQTLVRTDQIPPRDGRGGPFG
jgi:rhodanese-related sulfurtransferase